MELSVLAFSVVMSFPSMAFAEDSSASGGAPKVGVALTLGEGMCFVDHQAYRGPLNLEVVPAVGWTWLNLDLGIGTTLEAVEIADTNVGDWAFKLRPGLHLSPIVFHALYGRVAFPVDFRSGDVDWGI